jgi:hypothetical protein
MVALAECLAVDADRSVGPERQQMLEVLSEQFLNVDS